MASQRTLVPLHLSGNTTEEQNKRLKECLEGLMSSMYLDAIARLDRQSAQAVIETEEKLKIEIMAAAEEIIRAHTRSDKYKDEQAPSDRTYPAKYKIRPVEAQVTELRKAFPKLGKCQEKIGRISLPDGPEGWFAIPRWQALARSYNEAVEMLLDELVARRRFSNRIADRLGEKYLRQTERSRLAETFLDEQQPDDDILVIAAQAGMLHRGCSARRTRISLASNEYALGVFAIGSLLLTHPERLSTGDALMIDCGGDEYSPRADYTFDRVPLFDFDLSGIEFSIFYEDRARNLWGTPTGFLYRIV